MMMGSAGGMNESMEGRAAMMAVVDVFVCCLVEREVVIE